MEFADIPGPMVLFSTPGMLHGGQSLKVFKKWCSDERNAIINAWLLHSWNSWS
uniref:Beta-Casp domain-containing protein n=1 Tax=Meloidogyne incognita TaxID=6306 RepID=A0A914NAE3_MELIC